MKCRICHNEENNKKYVGKDKWFGKDEEFNYFQCSRCDCLQIDEYPLNISEYYPNEDYYSFQSLEKINNNKLTFRKHAVRLRDKYAVFGKGFIGKLLFWANSTNIYNMLAVPKVNKNTKIIDVGCGDGSWLHMLREMGFQSLLGTDPFLAKKIEYKNGLTILNNDIFQIKDKYEIVSLRNSFEHMPDPLKVLNHVQSILSDDGYCVIRIPIVSYAWKHYKENWIQFDAPRHFYLHSVESMKIVADQSGFYVCNVLYDAGMLQFYGSEQILKDIPLHSNRSYMNDPKNSIFSKKEISNFKAKTIELNKNKQGDVAIFFLKKKK